MFKMFVIEDDKGIADGIKNAAATWDIDTVIAQDFRNVMSEFAMVLPHIVLIDISLPFYNGYHWCQEIRKVSSVPIIFVSSVSDNMNMIMAMNMGADDFISKPFNQSFLIAKIQALLRRTYNFGTSSPVYEHRGAILNTGDSSVSYNGSKLELSKNEYRIMLVLLQNKGKVVSREKLMEALWETDCFVDENTLTVNVGRLRKRLDNAGLENFITTRFGVGYIVEG